MSNGFIFVINNNPKYLSILDIAIRSVLDFTNNSIEIHGINFDYCNLYGDRIIVKRINVEKEDFDSITLSKFTAINNSSFKIGIYLDSDIIITPKLSRLFNIFEYNNISHPILPKHCQSDDAILDRRLQRIVKRCNINIGKIYHHANIILFSDRIECRQAMQECLDLGMFMIKNNINFFAGDECVINMILWKKKVNINLDVCDANYTEFETMLGIKNNGDIDKNSLLYVSHGCKDYDRALNIYTNLKKYNN